MVIVVLNVFVDRGVDAFSLIELLVPAVSALPKRSDGSGRLGDVAGLGIEGGGVLACAVSSDSFGGGVVSNDFIREDDGRGVGVGGRFDFRGGFVESPYGVA